MCDAAAARTAAVHRMRRTANDRRRLLCAWRAWAWEDRNDGAAILGPENKSVMTAEAEKLDQEALDQLERRYDSALALRPIGPLVAKGFFLVAIIFALYHYFAAGFGVPVDYWHMGIHLTGLFFLIFVGFPFLKSERAHGAPRKKLAPPRQRAAL